MKINPMDFYERVAVIGMERAFELISENPKSEPKCESCRHFVKIFRTEDQPMQGYGKCHRNAPYPEGGKFYPHLGEWPDVFNEDRCGEYCPAK